MDNYYKLFEIRLIKDHINILSTITTVRISQLANL